MKYWTWKAPDERIKMSDETKIDMVGGNGGPVNEPLPEPDTREAPGPFEGDAFCVHEIVPEVQSNPTFGPDAMRFVVKGHKMGEPDSNDHLFSMVTGVPNAAVFASKILEEVGKSDPLTQLITTIALQREMAEQAAREAKAAGDVEGPAEPDDPMSLLAAIFGDGMGGMIVPIDTETAPGPEESDDPEELPADGSGVKAVRFSGTDDPVRIMYLPGNPDGRSTFAPIDNRDEYPGMGEGGYL